MPGRGLNVVVSAFLGSDNWGDEAIFACLVTALTGMGVSRQSITAVSSDPAQTARQFGVQAVSERAIAATASAVERADALILGGGGLIQDISNGLTLPRQLARPLLARWSGTPIITYGLGASALSRHGSRSLTRAALCRAHRVYVRDTDSARALVACGVPVSGVYADPVLAWPRPSPATTAKVGPPTLVVCLRPVEKNRGLLPTAWEYRAGSGDDGSSHAFAASVASTLDRLVEDEGVHVVLVPFWRGRDEALHRQVKAAMRRSAAAEVLLWEGLDDVADAFSSATAVLSMRLHASILATRLGVPFRALAYMPKVTAFLEMADRSSWGFAPEDVGTERFRLELASAVQASSAERLALRQVADQLERRVADMHDDLSVALAQLDR